MKKLLTIVSSKDNHITTETFSAIKDYLKVNIQKKWLEDGKACEIYFDYEKEALVNELREYFNINFYDWAYQNAEDKNKNVFISDMDSTIIKQECIDEIAGLVNVKEEVADITRRSMEGEIPFTEALQKRVSLLKGIKVQLLDDIYSKIEFNDGAEKLLLNLNKQKIKTILVSGGFTFFTEKISNKLNFMENHANSLEVIDGMLSGRLILPIIDSSSKREILRKTVKAMRIKSSDVIAVGDGANDLEMIRDAGLGISFKGKPVLKKYSNGQIEHTDLSSLLFFIGIPKDKIID